MRSIEHVVISIELLADEPHRVLSVGEAGSPSTDEVCAAVEFGPAAPEAMSATGLPLRREGTSAVLDELAASIRDAHLVHRLEIIGAAGPA